MEEALARWSRRLKFVAAHNERVWCSLCVEANINALVLFEICNRIDIDKVKSFTSLNSRPMVALDMSSQSVQDNMGFHLDLTVQSLAFLTSSFLRTELLFMQTPCCGICLPQG